MENYISELNVICANEHLYTDKEFAHKLDLAYERIPKNVLLNHMWTNNIVTRRVQEYCKYNKLELKDYNGPLPFRMFVIPNHK